MPSLFIILNVLCLVTPILALNSTTIRPRRIYQLLTDRFATSSGSSPSCTAAAQTYCGGSWSGIQSKLSYIQGMGFDTIWISPVVANIGGNTTRATATTATGPSIRPNSTRISAKRKTCTTWCKPYINEACTSCSTSLSITSPRLLRRHSKHRRHTVLSYSKAFPHLLLDHRLLQSDQRRAVLAGRYDGSAPGPQHRE